MLWSCPEQCDWWLSGAVEQLAVVLPRLLDVSDLRASLWSNDDLGIDVLTQLRDPWCLPSARQHDMCRYGLV